MSKRLGLLCMLLGSICILAALCLLAHNCWEEWRAEQSAKVVLPIVQKAIADGEGEDGAVEADGEQYLGYLSIPKLSLNLPVQKKWDFDKLQIAPCRYRGSVDDGNLVIAAHNYVRHFAKLHTLEAGDSVQFTDAYGTIHSYRIKTVEQMNPDEGHRMLTGDWDLTLFTCTYSGNQRTAVRCVEDRSKRINTSELEW